MMFQFMFARLGLSAISRIFGGNEVGVRVFQTSSAYIESNSSYKIAYVVLLEFYFNFAFEW